MGKLRAYFVFTALATFVPGGAVAQQLNSGLDVETVIGTEIANSSEYAAKFVCGLPPGETGAFVGPIAPGFYITSINIFNPNGAAVTMDLRVLEVSRAGGGNPGHRTATGSKTIGSLAGIKIDCFDVAAFFGQPDFVVITVGKKTLLNVVAVYTASVGGT